jgi:hypothetical protein
LTTAARERQRGRVTKREPERQTQRARERDRDIERERQRERHRETETQRVTERKTETERQRGREVRSQTGEGGGSSLEMRGETTNSMNPICILFKLEEFRSIMGEMSMPSSLSLSPWLKNS